jgi:hypothetical protein
MKLLTSSGSVNTIRRTESHWGGDSNRDTPRGWIACVLIKFIT